MLLFLLGSFKTHLEKGLPSLQMTQTQNKTLRFRETQQDKYRLWGSPKNSKKETSRNTAFFGLQV